jgi:hypothetical protein
MSGILSRITICVAFLASITLLTVTGAIAAGSKTKGGNADMHLHHMHTMMCHGLTMALQGSNLVMLSEMKMAPGVDEVTLSHGKKMVADGKAMIQGMLSGKHMTKMHKDGHGTSPLMKYTHELGNAMLAAIADIDSMKMEGIGGPDDMKMHHMHIALNHALEMAAEGAGLIMMGQMKMTGGIDRHSVDHGRQMIADARQLWKDVMSGSAMSEMHKAGTTPEASAMMAATHKLSDNEKKVLDLLADMPAVK